MSLQDMQGQRTLAVFFDPNCGFCRQMAQDLGELPADGLPGGPAPIVITMGDEEQNRKLVAEFGITCPVLLQRDREVAAAYSVTGTPMAYVIDAQGRIASELGVGAQGVLTLADRQDDALGRQNGDATRGESQPVRQRNIRPVTISRILRSGLPAGSPAPALRLPSLDGGEVSLEDYRGRRVFLVFSDPTSAPCNQLAPHLERLHRSVTDLQVLVVSRGTVDANREKVREHGLTFPVLVQRRWEASRVYGMLATPIAYLIDERGIIAADVAYGLDAILALVARAEAQQAEAVRA
jgi:peroxiredoxin